MNIVMTENNAHNIRFKSIELDILTKGGKVFISYDVERVDVILNWEDKKVIICSKNKKQEQEEVL